MKILSLFDGMACGALAMQAAGIEIDKSQAYKMLGNGWTVEVIAHLLRGLK